LADFDLSGRPPDYKTAALPIELRQLEYELWGLKARSRSGIA
jgi:hypothetical protein